MANPKIIEQKAAKVEEIAEKFERAQSVVLVDYRGFTVEEVTNLRNEFRAVNVEYAVLKNERVSRAAQKLGYDGLQQYLAGPNAFAFGVGDPVAPARVLKNFIKKAKKGEIKSGVVNGKVMDAQAINELADLPAREVLLARMLGSMLAPVTSLAIALDKIRQQKEEAGASA